MCKNRLNTRNVVAIVICLAGMAMFSGCEKNEMGNNSVIHDYIVQNILYAKGSKLKNISYVESVNSKKGGIIITQYEYDERGRISKVSQPMYENGTSMYENGTIIGLFSYSDYVYNNKGQLEKIIYYHSNVSAGFLNLETYTYSYDKNGNKLKTLIEHPVISKTDSILYFYEKGRLVRENKYDSGPFESYGVMYINGGLVSYTEYEYDSYDNLVKETYYSGTNNTPIQFSVHSYQSGLNVKTEIFSIKNDLKAGEIRRYYDKNDNLIYLESKELAPYSSSMSYVVKYEYY